MSRQRKYRIKEIENVVILWARKKNFTNNVAIQNVNLKNFVKL